MKALTFSITNDPSSPYRGIQGLKEICSDFGINLVRRPHPGEPPFNADELLKEFLDDIETADIFVLEGYMFWLLFFYYEEEVESTIIRKIESGTPIFLQSVRGWEKYFRNSPREYETIRKIYKTIGVTPTEKQVFSPDMAAKVGGGSEAYFRAGDNCLINGSIFKNVDSVVLGEPNIISIECGAFPIIEIGSMHYLVDSGDLPTGLDLSIRPVVAAEIQREKVNGIVVAGRFLSDGYDALGGRVTGIELNEVAVRNTIELLRQSVRAPLHKNYMSDLYVDFVEVERGLARILVARVEEEFRLGLDKSNLRDIVEICVQYFPKISDLFPGFNPASFSMKFSSLPSGARQMISHPVQVEFGRHPTESEKANLAEAALLVKKACYRL